MPPWFGIVILLLAVVLIYLWNGLVLRKTRLEFSRAALLLCRKKYDEAAPEDWEEAAGALAEAERSFREAAGNFRKAVSGFPGRELAGLMRIDAEKLLAPPETVGTDGKERSK